MADVVEISIRVFYSLTGGTNFRGDTRPGAFRQHWLAVAATLPHSAHHQALRGFGGASTMVV